MSTRTKLELTWIGKENRPKLEPRILLEDPEKSHHAAHRRLEGWRRVPVFQACAIASRERQVGYAVKSLAIFGSAARDTLAATSDVDLLVEFETAAGFDHYMDLKFFLEELVGRSVDLVTRVGLRSELGARVELEAIHVA